MSDSDSDVMVPSIKFGSDSDSDSDAPSSSKKSKVTQASSSDSDDDHEPKAPPSRKPVKKPTKNNPKTAAKKSAAKAQKASRSKAKTRGRRTKNPRIAKANEYRKSSIQLAAATGEDAFDAHLDGLAKAIASRGIKARDTADPNEPSELIFTMPQTIFDEVSTALKTSVIEELMERVNRFLVYRRHMTDKQGNPKFKEDGTPETRQLFKYRATFIRFNAENVLVINVE